MFKLNAKDSEELQQSGKIKNKAGDITILILGLFHPNRK